MIDLQERREKRNRAARRERTINLARIALSLGSVTAFALLLTLRHPSEATSKRNITPTPEVLATPTLTARRQPYWPYVLGVRAIPTAFPSPSPTLEANK